MRSGLTLLLALILLTSSCDQLQRASRRPGGIFGPSEQALREYHDSRWQAVVRSIAEGRDKVSLPAEPEVPSALQGLDLEDSYQQLAGNRTAEESSWQELISQSELSMRFIAEMLDVLERNDADSIGELAPQIDDYTEQQQEAAASWRRLRGELRARIDTLQQAWDSAWPDNEFDFDLLAQVERIQADQLGRLSPERIAALTHYHDNEFSRLARDYLGYIPPEGIQVSSQAHVPEGCEGIQEAVKGLEAALVLRHALDTAIVRDTEVLEQYVPNLLDGDQSLADIEIPDVRYGGHRARLAVARLQLYRLLDRLLVDVLDVMIFHLEREWTLVWPGNELENNIFAWAGMPGLASMDDPYEHGGWGD